jgi:protein-S-isoprenylcysteine O-methyltransferase Ste14
MDMTMLTNLEITSLLIGGIAGSYLLGAFAWSIIFPDRRVWPPNEATSGIKIRVWLATVAIFAATVMLGVANWNSFNWPAPVRWGVGVPLILIGNLVVWMGVFKIGLGATSGEIAELKTDGLYRYSRNPQYVADMAILLGWVVLSASGWAVLVASLGIIVLAAAPFAEEPWLEEAYGENYIAYTSQTRRYL